MSVAVSIDILDHVVDVSALCKNRFRHRQHECTGLKRYSVFLVDRNDTRRRGTLHQSVIGGIGRVEYLTLTSISHSIEAVDRLVGILGGDQPCVVALNDDLRIVEMIHTENCRSQIVSFVSTIGKFRRVDFCAARCYRHQEHHHDHGHYHGDNSFCFRSHKDPP